MGLWGINEDPLPSYFPVLTFLPDCSIHPRREIDVFRQLILRVQVTDHETKQLLSAKTQRVPMFLVIRRLTIDGITLRWLYGMRFQRVTSPGFSAASGMLGRIRLRFATMRVARYGENWHEPARS